MRQLPFLFACWLSLLANNAPSQSFKKGFVILPGEDTLTGYIQEDSYENLSRSVTFKPEKSADSQVFTPDKLLSFGYREGDFFKSADLHFDVKDKDGWRTFTGQRFLYRLVEGEVSLYELKDEVSQPLFFQKGNMPPVLLCYNRNGNPEFAEVLAAHLTGCEFVKVPPTLSLSQVQALIEDYNECSNSPEREKLPFLQAWISAGLFLPNGNDGPMEGFVGPMQGISTEWRPFQSGFLARWTLGADVQHYTPVNQGPGYDNAGYPFSKYRVDFWEYAVRSRFFLSTRKGIVLPYVFAGMACRTYISKKSRINPTENQTDTLIKAFERGIQFQPGIGLHTGFGRHLFRLEIPIDNMPGVRIGYGMVLWK
jgi:hypothetical protein